MEKHKLKSSNGFNLTIALVLAGTVLLCVFLWDLGAYHVARKYGAYNIDSVNGTWDLESVDFENNFVRLTGEVEYIPGKLLTPEEFEENPDEIKVGNPQYETNVSTSRIRLLLPEDGRYAVSGYTIDYSDWMYVNGELALQAGKPGYTAEESVPGSTQVFLEAEPQNGVIEIVQQTSNFAHHESGGHGGYYFGSYEIIRERDYVDSNARSAMMWVFMTLFLVNLLLYIIYRAYRANLYFALFCLVWFFRTGITGPRVLGGLFPELPWEAMFRIEYIAIPAAAILLLLLIRELFPGVLQKWFIRLLAIISAVFIALYMFADTVFMSRSLVVFEVIYMASIAYLIVRLCIVVPRMVKAKTMRAEQSITLAGLACFLYSSVHDAFYHMGFPLFGLRAQLTGLMLLIFVFFQMGAALYGTMRSVRASWERERGGPRKGGCAEKQAALFSEIPGEHLVVKGPLTLNRLAGQASCTTKTCC
jgi:hypothetical protein